MGYPGHLEPYVAFCQPHPLKKFFKVLKASDREFCKHLTEELNSCRGRIRSVAKWEEVIFFILIYVTFCVFASSFLYVGVECVEEPIAHAGREFENESEGQWWRTKF